MTDLRKAAEMALERLESHEYWMDEGAIKALRQALAQPEQEPFNRLIRIMGTFDLATGHADSWDELLDSLESELRDVLGYHREALRQALAQPDEVLAEREACANVCAKMWHEWLDSPTENEINKPDAEDCADAIRARGAK